MIKGQCLCGEVKFIIHYEKLKCYSCHCSLCRKATGSFSNAATMIGSRLFEFESVTDNIKLFTKKTGFQSSFCGICGSVLPNQLRDTDMHWIPVGLLENNKDITLVAHIHMDSKAHWDTQIIQTDCAVFSESPGIEKVSQLLSD